MQFKNLTRQLMSQLSRHLPRRLVQRDPMPDGKVVAKGRRYSGDADASLPEICRRQRRAALR
ncbi:Uncharacterised protein [Cedecea neteri]|uniref:Uncharacterized protein n=1 Tax=Cedecea neteri TaxID=158822 RepID=A0A2X2TIP1_9ENTR|nr:Uncharacterised protein [Cedecea neteri]